MIGARGTHMTNNVGRLDAAIRWALAATFFAIAIVFHEVTVVTLGSALAAVVLAGTAATRICPFYGVLGLHTNRERDQRREARGPARRA